MPYHFAVNLNSKLLTEKPLLCNIDVISEILAFRGISNSAVPLPLKTILLNMKISVQTAVRIKRIEKNKCDLKCLDDKSCDIPEEKAPCARKEGKE